LHKAGDFKHGRQAMSKAGSKWGHNNQDQQQEQ
jgi:hypothetical protein